MARFVAFVVMAGVLVVAAPPARAQADLAIRAMASMVLAPTRRFGV